MPLNYSKWDALEVICVVYYVLYLFVNKCQVSDDSDIEGHPNVDHKSLVRWKQRDIHEKRMMRNAKIENLKADVDCNIILRERLVDIEKQTREGGPQYFSNLVERLRTQPSPDKPPQSGPDAPSYDAMILMLLNQIFEQFKDEGWDQSNLGEKLATAVSGHIEGLRVEIEKKKAELDEELSEKKKKITSEDIHESWDNKVLAVLRA